jgi:hypothetical protein
LKKKIFLVTYCKRSHPKNRFYEKVKMTTKRTTILESFVPIGSFDCDCTLESFLLGEWEELQAFKIFKHIYALVMLFPSKPPLYCHIPFRPSPPFWPSLALPS